MIDLSAIDQIYDALPRQLQQWFDTLSLEEQHDVAIGRRKVPRLSDVQKDYDENCERLSVEGADVWGVKEAVGS